MGGAVLDKAVLNVERAQSRHSMLYLLNQ
jgi:hypothetical protein